MLHELTARERLNTDFRFVKRYRVDDNNTRTAGKCNCQGRLTVSAKEIKAALCNMVETMILGMMESDERARQAEGRSMEGGEGEGTTDSVTG